MSVGEITGSQPDQSAISVGAVPAMIGVVRASFEAERLVHATYIPMKDRATIGLNDPRIDRAREAHEIAYSKRGAAKFDVGNRGHFLLTVAAGDMVVVKDQDHAPVRESSIEFRFPVDSTLEGLAVPCDILSRGDMGGPDDQAPLGYLKVSQHNKLFMGFPEEALDELGSRLSFQAGPPNNAGEALGALASWVETQSRPEPIRSALR